jgi:flagellar M-ring protein FliF
VSRGADLVGQGKRFWSGLSPARRMTLLATTVLVAGGIAAVTLLSGNVEWAPVFTHLGSDDAGLIAQKLKELKIPFQVEGSALLVPRDRVQALRLELAGLGLPRGGGIGFELFDKRTLGQTDFTQKLNYRRALMGELARTISSLAAVERARVHLALPERTIFASRQQPASASVVVKLRAGQSLGRGQVQGIVHLVSSAVEGLKPENVTVIDEEGRLLWRSRGGSESAAAQTHDEAERALERRAAEMLERVVGAGRAVVRVTADVDLERRETTVEDYDPEVQVLRSEQHTRETLGGAQSATGVGGVPGASANAAGAGASPPVRLATSTTAAPAARESAVRNYEIKRTTQRTVLAAGRIRKLSVAVLVDGKYEEKDGKRMYLPREPSELQKLEELVKSAVGFQAARGDQLAVKSIPFDAAATQVGIEGTAAAAPVLWPVYVKWGGIGFLALLGLLFVVRPVLRAISARPNEAPSAAPAAAQAAAPAPAPRAALNVAAGETVEMPVSARDEALGFVRADPKRAAQVVRRWIQEKGT